MVAFLLAIVAAVASVSSTREASATVTVSRTVTVQRAGLYRGVSAAGWAKVVRRQGRELRKTKRALRATIRPGYGNDWLERAFLCIHSHEGAWNDSRAPYWGGLQMDASFMRSYGDWALQAFGTADNWPVSVQLATAIRAKVSGRGFGPWPNTARACGLR